jgi:hypothetical protein
VGRIVKHATARTRRSQRTFLQSQFGLRSVINRRGKCPEERAKFRSAVQVPLPTSGQPDTWVNVPPDAVFAKTSRSPRPDNATTSPPPAVAAVVGLPTQPSCAALDVAVPGLPLASTAVNQQRASQSHQNRPHDPPPFRSAESPQGLPGPADMNGLQRGGPKATAPPPSRTGNARPSWKSRIRAMRSSRRDGPRRCRHEPMAEKRRWPTRRRASATAQALAAMPSPRRPCPQRTGTPSWHHVAVMPYRLSRCRSCTPRDAGLPWRRKLRRGVPAVQSRNRRFIRSRFVCLYRERRRPGRYPPPWSAPATQHGTVSGVLYRRGRHRRHRPGQQHARRPRSSAQTPRWRSACHPCAGHQGTRRHWPPPLR